MVRVDKKDLIIDGAVAIFAECGYYKATTAQIAQAAGVTQPYVFNFFKNKEALYQAVMDRAFSRVFQIFKEVEASTDELYQAMGTGFVEVMKIHPNEILMIMQSHTITEPAIRMHTREKFKVVYDTVLDKFQKAGLSEPEAKTNQFIADGMMLTLSKVLDLPQLCRFE